MEEVVPIKERGLYFHSTSDIHSIDICHFSTQAGVYTYEAANSLFSSSVDWLKQQNPTDIHFEALYTKTCVMESTCLSKPKINVFHALYLTVLW